MTRPSLFVGGESPDEAGIRRLIHVRRRHARALAWQVERFFFDVHDIPLFSQRLTALHATQAFAEQAASAQALLETITTACAQLQASAGFEALLALLLLAGNAMNVGQQRGGAVGFDLGIVTKLADVKSMHRGDAKRSHSLLQVMPAEMWRGWVRGRLGFGAREAGVGCEGGWGLGRGRRDASHRT